MRYFYQLTLEVKRLGPNRPKLTKSGSSSRCFAKNWLQTFWTDNQYIEKMKLLFLKEVTLSMELIFSHSFTTNIVSQHILAALPFLINSKIWSLGVVILWASINNKENSRLISSFLCMLNLKWSFRPLELLSCHKNVGACFPKLHWTILNI